MSEKIRVEVAYARPESQKILSFDVELGTTAEQAAALSGMTGIYPEIDLASAPLGIFGNALGTRGLPAASDYVMQGGRPSRDLSSTYRRPQRSEKKACR